MRSLIDLVDEHPGALNYDLMRCGARLRDWPDNGVTWGDLLDLVRHAQPDTATFKALNPKWQQTVEAELLRSQEFTLRWLKWAKTEDATRGRNAPEPLRWPWDEKPDETISGDSMTLDEARDWLGWENQMRND